METSWTNKPRLSLIIGASVFSFISLALITTAFATENWITGNTTYESVSAGKTVNNVNHGLFRGYYKRKDPQETEYREYTITATCLMSQQVCAFSCQDSWEERESEVQRLYYSGTSPFTCPTIQQLAGPKTSPAPPIPPVDSVQAGNFEKFMLSSTWLSTIIFLSFSVLLAFITNIVTLWNIFRNPKDTLVQEFGLYVWFSVGAASDTIVLIIWGVEYHKRLSRNIAVLDTITEGGFITENSQLGYSYWLLIGSLVARFGGIACMLVKKWWKPGRYMEDDGGKRDDEQFVGSLY